MLVSMGMAERMIALIISAAEIDLKIFCFSVRLAFLSASVFTTLLFEYFLQGTTPCFTLYAISENARMRFLLAFLMTFRTSVTLVFESLITFLSCLRKTSDMTGKRQRLHYLSLWNVNEGLF